LADVLQSSAIFSSASLFLALSSDYYSTPSWSMQ